MRGDPMIFKKKQGWKFDLATLLGTKKPEAQLQRVADLMAKEVAPVYTLVITLDTRSGNQVMGSIGEPVPYPAAKKMLDQAREQVVAGEIVTRTKALGKSSVEAKAEAQTLPANAPQPANEEEAKDEI